VIVLDTHILIWWMNQSDRLRAGTLERIETESDAVAVSAISLWEIAKLVQGGRLQLSIPVEDWIEQALAYPKVVVVPLSPVIVVESTRLPQPFHKDPADELIVASARVLACPLITYDRKILNYPHLQLL
jgi:PIN domain nuclease of toxin-antitoxin system